MLYAMESPNSYPSSGYLLFFKGNLVMEFKIEDKNEEKNLIKFLKDKFLQFGVSYNKEQAKKKLNIHVLTSWQRPKKRMNCVEIE